jgi:HNH endonuclease
VCADMARQTAEQMLQQTDSKTTTRFTVYDDDGNVAADGFTRRRPPAPMAASIRASINRCVFPRCWRPARDCDLDHQQRVVDGGETTADNLHPLCRRHHRAKDEGGWRYEVLDKGVYQWTSPLGQVVVEDRRRFRNELDEDRQHGLADGVVDSFGGPSESLSADELVEALIDILADAPEGPHRADSEPRRTGGRSDERSNPEAPEVSEPQAPQCDNSQPPRPVTTEEQPAGTPTEPMPSAETVQIVEEPPTSDRQAHEGEVEADEQADSRAPVDVNRADGLTRTRFDDGDRRRGDGLVGC